MKTLLNTSLNLYEKPIIDKPIDIINEFFDDKGFLEYIYVHDSICLKKIKINLKIEKYIFL